MYRFWVLVHIVGASGFLLSHGVSVAVSLKLRREREPERIRALLGLSAAWLPVMNVSLLLLLTGGVVAGFLGHWWGRAWIWVSLGVFVGMAVAMTPLGVKFYDRVRAAVGERPRYAKKDFQPPPLAAAEELHGILSSGRPLLLTTIGVAALLVILWLMVYKPF